MAEQQADQRRSGPSEGPLSASSVFSVALVAFAIVALSVVAALARSAPAVRVICIAMAVAGCALLAVTIAARRRLLDPTPAEKTVVATVSDRVVARVAELATALACPTRRVTPTSKQPRRRSTGREISSDRTTRTAPNDSRAAAAQVRHESLTMALEDLEAERDSFAAWKLVQGLGPALSPDGVLESLTTLQEAWKNLGALDRVDAKIDQLRAESRNSEPASPGCRPASRARW